MSTPSLEEMVSKQLREFDDRRMTVEWTSHYKAKLLIQKIAVVLKASQETCQACMLSINYYTVLYLPMLCVCVVFNVFAQVVVGDIYWKEHGRDPFPVSHHVAIIGAKAVSKTGPLTFFHKAAAVALKKMRIFALQTQLITAEERTETTKKYKREYMAKSDGCSETGSEDGTEEMDIDTQIETDVKAVNEDMEQVPDIDIEKIKKVCH